MATTNQKMLALSGIIITVMSLLFYVKIDTPLKGDLTGFVIFGSIGLLFILYAMVWPRKKKQI